MTWRRSRAARSRETRARSRIQHVPRSRGEPSRSRASPRDHGAAKGRGHANAPPRSTGASAATPCHPRARRRARTPTRDRPARSRAVEIRSSESAITPTAARTAICHHGRSGRECPGDPRRRVVRVRNAGVTFTRAAVGTRDKSSTSLLAARRRLGVERRSVPSVRELRAAEMRKHERSGATWEIAQRRGAVWPTQGGRRLRLGEVSHEQFERRPPSVISRCAVRLGLCELVLEALPRCE